VLFRARQYESAVARYQRALELDAGYVPALTRMTDVYTAMGKYDEALVCIKKLRQVTDDSSAGSLQLLALYAHTGKRREALDGLTTMQKDGSLAHDTIGAAYVYAALGEDERAITVVEQGIETRSTLAFILVDPRLDSLRSDPRFRQLLRRARVPS
jgi:tetratricopeptide (TPR) repeat protein